MCITFFQQLTDKEFPFKFIFGFNRDVNINRPTLQINQFEEDKNIIAGRDLVGSGTWLGVNIKTNVIAILTNYDTVDFIHVKNMKYGRGYVPMEFLSSSLKAQDDSKILEKINKIKKDKDQYNGFNIIIGNFNTNNFYYYCNKYEGDIPMPYKLYEDITVLCNCDIFEQWEKVKYGLNLFKNIVKENNQKGQKGDKEKLKQKIFELMIDNKQFEKNVEEESSIFVEQYENSYYKNIRGTTSTCIIILDQNNNLDIKEYTFNTKKNVIDKKNPLIKQLNYQLNTNE